MDEDVKGDLQEDIMLCFLQAAMYEDEYSNQNHQNQNNNEEAEVENEEGLDSSFC